MPTPIPAVKFDLCLPWDAMAAASGLSGENVGLSEQVDATAIDWILVESSVRSKQAPF